MSARRRRAFLAVVAALGAAAPALCGPAAASAAYDPVGGGQTTLTLAPSFLRAMKAAGIELSAVAPAKRAGRLVVFPAVAGKFDPLTERGTVEHEGALLLRSGGRRIPLKALKLRTSQRSAPFLAKVGGSQLKVGTTGSLVVSRHGFDEQVRVSTLALSAKVATRLGKKLARRVAFRPGQSVGSFLTEVAPATTALLARGAATLTLAPEIAAKLQSLFVAVNPVFPAERSGASLTLPISGGDLSLDGGAGRLAAAGALELIQLGGGQVLWRDLWLDLAARSLASERDAEPSPPYPGKAPGVPIGPFQLSGPLVADAGARTLAGSAAISLDPGTAALFEEAFAKPQGRQGVFLAGEPLGTLSFTAYGQ